MSYSPQDDHLPPSRIERLPWHLVVVAIGWGVSTLLAVLVLT